jgi:hypothetical protein
MDTLARHPEDTVILSARACSALVSETISQDPNETGGILLGYHEESTWHVVESIDPGPRSVFTPYTFEYDTSYVNHLAKKVASIYSMPLTLLGLWHRHPGSLDSFSGADDITNRRYYEEIGERLISCIVNIDPAIRITAYRVSGDLSYSKLKIVHESNVCHQSPPDYLYPILPPQGIYQDQLASKFFAGLFESYYREGIPLSNDLVESLDAILTQLDGQNLYIYALKACGSILQIALKDIANFRGHLIEVRKDIQQPPRLTIDGMSVDTIFSSAAESFVIGHANHDQNRQSTQSSDPRLNFVDQPRLFSLVGDIMKALQL